MLSVFGLRWLYMLVSGHEFCTGFGVQTILRHAECYLRRHVITWKVDHVKVGKRSTGVYSVHNL